VKRRLPLATVGLVLGLLAFAVTGRSTGLSRAQLDTTTIGPRTVPVRSGADEPEASEIRARPELPKPLRTRSVRGPLVVPSSGSLSPARPGDYGSLPVFFEANRGQADGRFAFIARGQEHGIYLAPTEAAIALIRDGERSPRFLHLNFVGANPRAAFTGEEKLPGTVNYFLGNDPAEWHTAVPTFASVRFEAVWPGIDLVYHSSEGRLEYDFIIAPGANPGAITLRFAGADRVRLGSNGDLILEAGEARVFQHKPVLYQTIAGQRRGVSGKYDLRGRGAVAFVVGRYDTNHPLVIDPILSYSTFLGGRRADKGWAVAVDSAGSAFVAGETRSVFKSVPASGFQTNYAGGLNAGGDAFIAKLNPAGTAFEFLTYLGGRGLDGAVGLALDAAGNPHVTGYTSSDNFPITAGVVQDTLAGRRIPRTPFKPSDAFVTKLNPTGSALIYSTFLGGGGFDSAIGIAVDAGGSAHITGFTETAGSFRSTNRVCTTVCTNSLCGPTVCRTNVVRATDYFPYFLVTNVTSFDVSTNPPVSNVVYQVVESTMLGLRTLDGGFPVTNAAQLFHGGDDDAFVAKLSPDATALIYSTYLGGIGRENGTGIAVDPAGNAFITGWTEGFDYPVTTNAFQLFPGPNREAFVTSLDPTGAVRYSTFLGGGGRDIGNRIAVDAAGSAYVTGAKASADFPTTPGALNRGGIFMSTDAADSWSPSGSGLTHTVVEALIRTFDGDLFAATPRGVFRSGDAGASWSASFSSLSVNGVNALAEGYPPSHLYAGTGRGLLLTTNGGASWFFESGGLGSRSVSTVDYAPPDFSVTPPTLPALLVGTRGRGVFISTNNGSSWRSANSGLGNLNVNALIGEQAFGRFTIYAATDGGVFKSTNGGLRWRASNVGLTTRRAQTLTIDPRFYSPSSEDTLYVGTSKGVFKSTNGGSNWVARGTGLGSSNVLALAIDFHPPFPIYAGTTNGLFKSTDGGATWTSNSAGLAPASVKALAFDLFDPGTLYAGLRGSNSFGGSNDVFVTKLLPDGSGLAWSLAFGGRRTDQGWDVAVDSSGRAFVTGSTDSPNFPIVNRGSLASTNAGKADAFLAQIEADGSSILFSGLLGGRRDDAGYAVALDSSGGAYLTGRTDSTNFPSAMPVQSALAGRPDVFIAKVVPEVALRVASTAGRVVVSWPGPMPGFTLEGAETMTGPWTAVGNEAVFEKGWHVVTLPAGSDCRFFRLRAVAGRTSSQ